MLKVKNVRKQLAFKNSSRPKLTVGGVAKVFGVGRRTFWRWNKDGRFEDVRKVKTTNGTLFDMQDIFRLAYPGLDTSGIAQMIMEFRERNGGRRLIK